MNFLHSPSAESQKYIRFGANKCINAFPAVLPKCPHIVRIQFLCRPSRFALNSIFKLNRTNGHWIEFKVYAGDRMPSINGRRRRRRGETKVRLNGCQFVNVKSMRFLLVYYLLLFIQTRFGYLVFVFIRFIAFVTKRKGTGRLLYRKLNNCGLWNIAFTTTPTDTWCV